MSVCGAVHTERQRIPAIIHTSIKIRGEPVAKDAGPGESEHPVEIILHNIGKCGMAARKKLAG
jgi:hypothetical protein